MSEQKKLLVDRSLLFVPGHRPERFDKAVASGAHQVVLDLEDAVGPNDKQDARQAIFTWLQAGGQAIVRINAAGTEWFDDDLKMLQNTPSAGVMLPKVCYESLTNVTNRLGGRTIIGLLETVSGYLELRQICSVAGLKRLAFGSLDFGTESGISDEADSLTAIRTSIVLESVYAGLMVPIDGVSTELNDPDRMRSDALRSKQLGFGGKLCIHPRQVKVVNDAFLPTREEYDWALKVNAAFQNSKGAATAVDGKMIDKPVVDHAQRIISDFTSRGFDHG